ncbi:retrotransposon protein, putative, ty1-copia subclass [Tanacetum coccineum]
MTRWLTGGPTVVNGGLPPLTGGLAVVNGGPPPLTGGQAVVNNGPAVVTRGHLMIECQIYRWRLDQSERDTWHWRMSVRGVRVSVRVQACMDPCQSLAIMSRLGLRGSRKLKHKALSLYMGNRKRAAVEAIRSFDLVLPSIFIHLRVMGYALESAARILNMVPTKKIERTPYEIWHGKASKLSYLRVWSCEALIKRDTPDKHDPRSIKCIFVGYPKEKMGHYFYYPLENKIFVARNAEFFKNSLMVQEASRSHGLLESSGSDGGLELIQEEDTQPSKNTSKVHNEVAPIEVEPQNVEVPIRRSERIPQAPDRYGFYVDVEEYELGDLNEPPNYKAALSDPEFDKWLEAMNTEMQSMKDNQVWVLVDLPSNG